MSGSDFPIVFIVGPTAVGKSSVALELADRLNGEIISCDSMQVYKEINVLNDKPSPDIQAQIPHHMIDIVSVTDDFDVVQHAKRVMALIPQVQDRQRVPIIVGGSGLYMKVLLDGIFTGPQRDDEFRAHLRDKASHEGVSFLYDQLKLCDPESADKIHGNDQKKIIRALEVYHLAQQPISQLQKKRQGLWGGLPVHVFALNRDRAELYQRIESRVDAMFAAGALDEIRALIDVEWSEAALRMIGVRETLAHLKGDLSWDEMLVLIKRNSRRFAKRQWTWYRKEDRIQWCDWGLADTVDSMSDHIMTKMKAGFDG